VLESISSQSTAIHIAFTRCSATDCVARVESSIPAEIDSFVAAAKQSERGFRIRVRERLTAFNGRTFQADLQIPAANVAGD
jgi:hypothetical protein